MITPSQIDLYCLESQHAQYFLNTELLSAAEKIRYDSYKYESDANNFLIARSVLKTKLAEKLEIEAASIELSISAMGKPYLENRYKKYLKNGQKLPQFSIAHCDGAVAVAISTEPVGVDVENIRRPSEPWRKAGRMINSHLKAALEGLSDAEAEYEFARHWTCLEAYVKLIESSIAKERAQFFLDSLNADGRLTFLQREFLVKEFVGYRLIAISYMQKQAHINSYFWSDTDFALS